MIPGDASFVGDWQFGVQEHLPQIGAPEAWDAATGDPGVVVAVIDTGVDLDHPILMATFYQERPSSKEPRPHKTTTATALRLRD